MKKIFTLIACIVSLYASAQQVNGSFDETWVDCVPWTSSNNTSKQGTQPVDWCVSNVIGMGGTGATTIASQSIGYNETGYAVTLTNTPNPIKSSQIIPAYITLGTAWNTAKSSLLGSISLQDGGTYGGKSFSYRPDGIKFLYKRSHGTADADEPAVVTAYLWKGTWSQASVPGNTSYITNPSKVTMSNRERNILDMSYSQGGDVTNTDDAKLLAYLKEGNNKYVSIMGDAAEWTEFTYDFTYVDTEAAPAMINIIIAANDYFGGATAVGKDNSITIDNVELVYNSSLSDLQLNGTTIEGFSKDVFEYQVAETYADGCIGFSKDCVGGVATGSWNSETNTYSIIVKGDDWSESNLNEHTYTITFKNNEGDNDDEPEIIPVAYDFIPSTTTPENGATATGVSFFSMQFEEYVNIDMNQSNTVNICNENGDVMTTGMLMNDMLSWGKGVKIQFAETLASGTYTITIPQGLLGNNAWVESEYQSGRANPELKFTFTNEELVVVTEPTLFTPENGATIESISQFEIAFAHAFDQSWEPEVTYPAIYDAEGNLVETITAANIAWNSDWTVMILKLETPITTDGEYTFKMAAGFINLMDDAYNTIGQNSEFNVTMTVKAPLAPVAYDFIPSTTTPENSATATGVSFFSMQFEEYVNIDMNQSNTVNICNENGDVMTTGMLMNDMLSWGKGVKIQFAETLASGTYTITIPQGLLGNNAWVESEYQSGRANPELKFTFTNEELVVVTEPTLFTPENGATIESISQFEIAFAHAFDQSWEPEVTYPAIYDAEGNLVETITAANIAWNSDWTVMILKLQTPITTDGEYTFKMAAGFINLMDDAYNTIGQNSEFNATIKVENGSSINDIAIEKDHVTVYNINGVKVIDNQPASELNKLKKGIYIINGKKVVIQ